MSEIFESDKKIIREAMHTVVACSQIKEFWDQNEIMTYVWELLFHKISENHGIIKISNKEVIIICKMVNEAVAKYYPETMKHIKWFSLTPKVGYPIGISIHALVSIVYIFFFVCSFTNVCLVDNADLEVDVSLDEIKFLNPENIARKITKKFAELFMDAIEDGMKEELSEIKDIYFNSKYSHDGEVKDDLKIIADATKLNVEMKVDTVKLVAGAIKDTIVDFADDAKDAIVDFANNAGDAYVDFVDDKIDKIKKWWKNL